MSLEDRLSKAERKQLVAWAKKALHPLDESSSMIGVLDGRALDVGRIEFTLQVGHCLLTGKPLILTVPHGFEIPPKLAAAAERIVRYDPNDPPSLQHALTPVLTELGANKQ
jgi:hypothetical protein